MTRPEAASMIFGMCLSAGGMADLWFHAGAASHRMWAAVVVMVLGAGIAFNREVVGMLRAWKEPKP
jgi:hypothetical protein